MDTVSAWNTFVLSGSVADYLKYKLETRDSDKRELTHLEIFDRRTGDTDYKRR